MLLGTSCSNVTESLAHVVPYWNILQVSSGSTSPSLSDRKKFPLFFRTVAPDSSHNTAKIDFVKHFGWKVVATFSQSENRFLLPLNKLIAALENTNVSCIATITFSLDNYKEQLTVLKEFDIRIIFGSFSAVLAPKIFCEVFKLGMYGAEYVWILQDQGELWWNNGGDCSASELLEAVEGIVLVSDYNAVSAGQTPVSGLNSQLFEFQLNLPKRDISKYAKLTYDAVWAIALTLKNSRNYAWNWDHLQSFNYKRKDIACDFVDKMNALKFIGLSGPVRFEAGDRIGNSVLRQLQGGRGREIAVFDSNKNTLNFQCPFCHQIHWSRGQIPIAQRILKVTVITVPAAVLYAIIFVSAMGISISMLFLYFNLHFRRMKTMKLSSPKLNNVAVIGCVLVYFSVILLGIDRFTFNSTNFFNELCTAGVYLLSVGFSLAFGSMFAKTYRVHRIFTYGGTAKVKDKLLKDKQLIALIFVPPVIDTIILTLWVMFDPMERQLNNLTLQISSTDPGIVYQPQVEVCRSQNTSGWLVAIYGYKGLILIMGVFMAWETRHIKVQALNDSQNISICVYSAVFSAIIVVLSTLMSDYFLFSYLARTISILTSTTITLILLFLPKLKLVFGQVGCQDPVMQSMGLKVEYNTRRLITNDPNEQIYRLEIQNKVYKCELAALDVEIARLEGLIASSPPSGTSGGVAELGRCELSRPPRCNRSSLPDGEARRLHAAPDESVFGPLNWIFDEITQMDHAKFNYPCNIKYNSNPEFYTYSIFPAGRNLIKAKSDISVVNKNYPQQLKY